MSTFDKVKEIASKNKAGFTISLLDFKSPKSGYIVAMNLTQDHFGDDGLKKVIEIAQKSTFYIGGWFDKQSKRYYYDCVMIEQDKEKALQLGKANKQKAIFDLENLDEIRL